MIPNSSIDVGGMGENLVTTDMNEFNVFIGDKYRLGDAMIEVSQPRQPCWKPARRYKVIDLALQIQQTGYTGWYYRVIEERSEEHTSELQSRGHLVCRLLL